MGAGPKIQCIHCEDVIQSMSRHDFRPCRCDRIFIDGGSSYTRIGFKEPSDYVFVSDSEEAEQE